MNTNNELFPEDLETSSHIENDESSIECVMYEKAKNSLRYVNNATYKQHICGIAKKRYLLAKKEKSKAVTKKQTVLQKALQIADKEQLLEIAAAGQQITPLGVILFSTDFFFFSSYIKSLYL